MYDFIAIDFETANNNLTSACSVGLAMVKEHQIIKTEEYLIKPPTMNFNKSNVVINGITPDLVENAPSFCGVWEKINPYFQGQEIIVAHNAHFDMSVLMNCLEHYNLEIPDFIYLCSIQLSNGVCDHIGNSLRDRTEYLGITLKNHHNSLNDAIACAQIVIECMRLANIDNLEKYCFYCNIPRRNLSDLYPQRSFIRDRYKYQRILISEISASSEVFDENHILYGKNIVITGELETMERKEAMQVIADLGGVNKSGVSSKTDFLIVGKQDKKVVGEDGMSQKEEKAYEFISKGHDIKVIGEEEFLQIIS